MPRWGWIALFIALLGAWHWWSYERPASHPPGAIAAAAPHQVDLDPAPAFEFKGRNLVKRARYDLTVRVLRKEIYRFDDAASLAPVDLAVGWGRMSDSAMLDQLSITQMGRFFYWQPGNGAAFSVPREALVSEAAQIHAIPATPEIERAVRRLRPGQVVSLSGYLVDVRSADGFTWRTSLTRTDTGNGACEIMWIEALALQ
ncbi:MAG TPA: hypothetical protein VFZ14_15985 [Burkholderiales bacterium]|jgi:hypothetical protein|nr:hypothetical protein [Burkholderiales bacterium]